MILKKLIKQILQKWLLSGFDERLKALESRRFDSSPPSPEIKSTVSGGSRSTTPQNLKAQIPVRRSISWEAWKRTQEQLLEKKRRQSKVGPPQVKREEAS